LKPSSAPRTSFSHPRVSASHHREDSSRFRATLPARGGSGNGPERALEAITLAIAQSAKADPPPSFPASAGPFPRSPKTHPPQRPVRLEMADPIATPALSERDGVA
jgi:hypothetical protein